MKLNEDQLPDVLREMKNKGDGFKSPQADYFSQLAERSMTEAKEAKVVSLSGNTGRTFRWLAYAATLALIIVAAWKFQSPPSNEMSESMANVEASNITLEDVDDAEILEYIDENIHDFELEQLAIEAELY